jgi:hypothetical protein|tara:strand:- start:347 stop:2359 length:2013 start_codon:yes stop_codon:yes gene_type:complete
MEFTEIVDVRSVRWLLTQLSQEFIFQNIVDENEKFNFVYVKKILQKMNKTGGKSKVKYEKKDKFGILRDYAVLSIQALPTAFRGLICKRMNDVDMVNAHPVIIYNLCKQHNISCLYLKEYCENRKKIIAEKKCSKMDIIKSINKQTLIKADNWLKSFDIEMKEIQKKLYEMDEYEPQRILSESKQKNKKGTFMSHLATSFEVKIIHSVIHSIDLNIGVLMYDGFMFYDEKPENLLQDLSLMVKDKTGFDIEWSYKEHDDSLQVPECFVEDNYEQMYESLKNKYEKDYCLAFIEEGCVFAFKVNNKICFLNTTDLLLHFQNVFIDKDNFLQLWFKDAERQTYISVGVFPHDVICPEGCLNIWEGFDVEKITPSDIDIEPILNHLRIITNENIMYEFLLDWMANMFQFPSSKSVMIIIQGMEGSGKSIICDLLGHMIGSGSIEIDDVKENLFGRFNDNLSRKVFVNLNEIDRKEMSQYFERIKSLITSPTINIEGKGQKKYTEQSLLHFITTTQNDNVFKITQESRRYCYFETNNELCGNTDYFNFLFNFIEKQSVQRAFYDYLMNRKVKQKITIKDIPITMAMREQFILNRDTIEDYIVEFTGDKNAQDNYNEYKTFMKNQGLEYVPSRKLFEMRFNKLMDQYDIKKKRQTIEGNRYTIYYRDSPPLLENN